MIYIYIHMTKNELKKLIKESIQEMDMNTNSNFTIFDDIENIINLANPNLKLKNNTNVVKALNDILEDLSNINAKVKNGELTAEEALNKIINI
jgi:polyhydroxyalkanoate synthesis regulator phasin